MRSDNQRVKKRPGLLELLLGAVAIGMTAKLMRDGIAEEYEKVYAPHATVDFKFSEKDASEELGKCDKYFDAWIPQAAKDFAIKPICRELSVTSTVTAGNLATPPPQTWCFKRCDARSILGSVYEHINCNVFPKNIIDKSEPTVQDQAFSLTLSVREEAKPDLDKSSVFLCRL